MIWPVASVWVAHISHTLGEETWNKKYSEFNGIEESVLCAVSLVSVLLFISCRWILLGHGCNRRGGVVAGRRTWRHCPGLPAPFLNAFVRVARRRRRRPASPCLSPGPGHGRGVGIRARARPLPHSLPLARWCWTGSAVICFIFKREKKL